MARIRNRPEETLQRSVAQFLDVALPDDAVWFAIPNGYKRTKAEAGIAKAMGQKAGIPDLCIIHEGNPIFIELKAKGGRVSPAQQHMQYDLTFAGAHATTCYSLQEVESYLTIFMTLRARAAA